MVSLQNRVKQCEKFQPAEYGALTLQTDGFMIAYTRNDVAFGQKLIKMIQICIVVIKTYFLIFSYMTILVHFSGNVK